MVAVSAVVVTSVLLVLAHVASEVMASLVSSMLPLELLKDQAAKVLVFVALEVASLAAKKPGELAV